MKKQLIKPLTTNYVEKAATFSIPPSARHEIRTRAYPHTPHGILFEPYGGIKNEQGRSIYQEAYAHLFAAAPDMLKALEAAKENIEKAYHVARCPNVKKDKTYRKICRAIKKATVYV